MPCRPAKRRLRMATANQAYCYCITHGNVEKWAKPTARSTRSARGVCAAETRQWSADQADGYLLVRVGSGRRVKAKRARVCGAGARNAMLTVQAGARKPTASTVVSDRQSHAAKPGLLSARPAFSPSRGPLSLTRTLAPRSPEISTRSALADAQRNASATRTRYSQRHATDCRTGPGWGCLCQRRACVRVPWPGGRAKRP